MKERFDKSQFPDIFNKDYGTEVVRLVNLKQVSMYIKNNIELLDIFYTDRLVFVFKKDDTTDIFKRWSMHEFE